MKSEISSLIEIKDTSEIIQNGILYHGTEIDNIKNILQNGVTPFSAKRTGSGEGLGRAFYTTQSEDTARFYSNNYGAVLPFKFNDTVAELKEKQQTLFEKITNSILEVTDPANETNTMSIGPTLMRTDYDTKALKEAQEQTPHLINRIMKDLGVDALHTEGGITKGLLTFNTPEYVKKADQVAIFNGETVTLDTELLKNLNPITKNNMHRFLN